MHKLRGISKIINFKHISNLKDFITNPIQNLVPDWLTLFHKYELLSSLKPSSQKFNSVSSNLILLVQFLENI